MTTETSEPKTNPYEVDINGEKVIFSGSGYNIGNTDKNFYAINSDGSTRFIIEINKNYVSRILITHLQSTHIRVFLYI